MLSAYRAVMQIDDVDRAILAILQRNSRTIAEDIGAEVGLSAAAVQRRIKRLRENGTINREVAVLDPRALGQEMTFVVLVELERERAHLLEELRRRFLEDEHVQQCYCVTGQIDFVLVISARDMAEFDAVTRRVLFDNPTVRRFTTNVVLDRVKVGLTVPTG
ncbi:Lrp/AsnC family transcriptional regulator [Allokutzneria multivorans]|uniref:Lrp/AsnC family transcriptional regulator n=2 Tax=Allokutzneria multivorans TaxID=1142134 RepID=A0ABP7U195_9PSEU